jgi:hypothetical protein
MRGMHMNLARVLADRWHSPKRDGRASSRNGALELEVDAADEAGEPRVAKPFL